jgi:hypothetical protein
MPAAVGAIAYRQAHVGGRNGRGRIADRKEHFR